MRDIISRAEWRARAPRSRIATVWGRRTEFVVHHSEGPVTQTVKSIQNFHMDVRGWSDIAYNFLVGDDGRIYEGRGWLVVGAHATGHNTSGIGVCYIGYNAPTDAAKASIRDLYDYACDKTGTTLLKKGHGQLSGNSTDCPGSTLLAWVKAGMPRPVVEVTNEWPYGPGVLMVKGWESSAGVERVQGALNALGYSPKLIVDGDFGTKTENAVKWYQERMGLQVDGIVGLVTWESLFPLAA